MTEGASGLPISVATGGGRSYEVRVAPGIRSRLGELLAERAPAERYAVVADRQVASLHADELLAALERAGARADLFTFPQGERSKTRGEWARLSDALLEAGFGRRSALVALGGGVTGDLAGFVAATYLRGIPVVHVPTTLLAMIDASIGGKTGVNVDAGKNLIGAFHPPALVVSDPEYTRTLPRARRAEGLAEALKHGAIRDSGHFEEVASLAPAILDGDISATAQVVERSARIKAAVVGEDERESGLRETLNFGHTIGHGLEAASGYELSHGEAVSLGMVLEARLGERLGVTATGTSQALADAVRRLELPTVLPRPLDPIGVMSAIGMDKKVRRERVRVVLLEATGAVAHHQGEWARPVMRDLVEAVVSEACESV